MIALSLISHILGRWGSGGVLSHFGITGVGFNCSKPSFQRAPNGGPVVQCCSANGDEGLEVGNGKDHVAEVLTRANQIMRCPNIIQRETGANKCV